MSRLLLTPAAHLLLRDDELVLFTRRSGSTYGAGRWSVPAGHLEQGETFHDACVREAAEEIGVELDPRGLELACVQHKHDEDGEERIDAFFYAVLPPGQSPVIREPDRCDRILWARLPERPSSLLPYVEHAIAHILAGRGPLAYFGFGSSSVLDGKR